MNRYSKNKEVVKICKNYYEIINTETDEKVINKIIRLYSDYIFSVEYISEAQKNKLEKIDNIMFKFVNDIKFKKEMCKYFLNIRIGEKITDIKEYIINKMIEFSEEYIDIYTRNIYIPRWI